MSVFPCNNLKRNQLFMSQLAKTVIGIVIDKKPQKISIKTL